MVISLFTVRIVLNTLGVIDYGIYNVVGGAVTMFSFFVGAMASSSQRYYSFMLGKKDEKGLHNVFNTTFLIYILITFLVLILAETIGLWFVYNKLNIPNERFDIALIVFQLTIISSLCNILTTPYVSSIIAHEQMGIYAKISILEAILKLVTVYILTLLNIDKLLLYGILQLISSFLISSFYIKFCQKKFPECHIVLIKRYDIKTLKEIAYFSIWSLLGNIASIVKNQGASFLLNIFYGPILNTAQTIANQIRTYSSIFFQNFSTAVKPQIIKLYASHEYDKMFSLIFQSCKFTYFLMLIVILPLIYNINYILHLWLDNIPEYVTIFSKILLLEALIDSISYPMSAANMATGKIRNYQIIICLITLFNLPISYILLTLNYKVESVFFVSAFLQIIITITRTLFLIKIQKKSFTKSLTIVYIPCLLVTILSIPICYILVRNETTNIINLFINVPLQVLIIAIIIFILGLNNNERIIILNLIKRKMIWKKS